MTDESSLYDIAKKFSMDEYIGAQKFNALMKDYVMANALLTEGGIDEESPAGKWFMKEIDRVKETFLEKTGTTLESVLLPGK